MPDSRSQSKLQLNYSHLQNTLGWIGLTLPVILVVYSWVYMGQQVQTSVSAYYHTHMGDYFVAMGCFLGLILIFYKGYELSPNLAQSPKFWQRIPDRWVSFPAGVSAIIVGLVPVDAKSCTWLTDELRLRLETEFTSTSIHCADSGITHTVDIVHYVAAGIFLLCTAFFCLLLFTRGNGTETNIQGGVTCLKLSTANRYFITCGAIILACVAYLSFEQFGLDQAGETKKWLQDARMFFWVEVISIWAFALAWLEQGRSKVSPFGWITQR